MLAVVPGRRGIRLFWFVAPRLHPVRLRQSRRHKHAVQHGRRRKHLQWQGQHQQHQQESVEMGAHVGSVVKKQGVPK